MGKHNFVKLFFVAAVLACAGVFSSCYIPNPLYGEWSDNLGNTIVFKEDETFSAKIRTAANDTREYSGSYSVQENALIIVAETHSMNTEWDIRGSMLYLMWTHNDGESKNLTLYRVSR